MGKLNIRVITLTNEKGQITPLYMKPGQYAEWQKITKVIGNPVRRASLKAGGVGMRYNCVINNIDTYLYDEEDKGWFIERDN